MPVASGRINMLRYASHTSLLCTRINPGIDQTAQLSQLDPGRF